MKKTKIRKLITWLDTGIFPATVMFTMGFTYDEIMKDLRRRKIEYWDVGLSGDKDLIDNGTYFALRRDIEHKETGDKKTMFYIIIKEQFNFSDYEYCKLAHEVLHIIQFMMKDFLDPEREFEACAYTHTHLMNQCLKQMRGDYD